MNYVHFNSSNHVCSHVCYIKCHNEKEKIIIKIKSNKGN